MSQKGTPFPKTTATAHAPTGRVPAHIRAIGYVRVSTELQATEGVSLDAQREKVCAFCKLHEIELIAVSCDEGISASSLKRPGLAAALRALESGAAQSLIVVKLDRLTRSVKDLGFLCEHYFCEGRPWSLLSVSDSIDTRSASGKLILNVLTSVAQWEREAISDRTKEAMQHLRNQGVQMGAAPFGYTYSQGVDEQGRRRLVEETEAQALIRRIVALHKTGMTPTAIGKQFRTEGLTGPRSGSWSTTAVQRVLVRQGRSVCRKPKSKHTELPRLWDRAKVIALIAQCHAEGLSLRRIAVKLDEALLSPPRGGAWHPATVQKFLDCVVPDAPPDAQTRARQLRQRGLSVRVIGRTLRNEGYRPERAMDWHNQAVSQLLAEPVA